MSKSTFIRSRLISVFDKLLTNILFYALITAIPIVLGMILNLGLQITLLILLAASQALIIVRLLLIGRRLSDKKKEKEILVSDDTGALYLMDRFGLPHPLTDRNTTMYLMQTFDYWPSDLARVSPNDLRPLGAEVIAISDWKPPRTKEDKMSSQASHEARRSLKLLKRYIRTENDSKALSFDIRNDGELSIQVHSAKLFLNPDAPLTVSDISPMNQPIIVGLLTCNSPFA